MKTKVAKIRLHRETVRNLVDHSLGQAAGGITATCGGCLTVTCGGGGCEFSGRATCNTCVLTCTTNRC